MKSTRYDDTSDGTRIVTIESGKLSRLRAGVLQEEP